MEVKLELYCEHCSSTNIKDIVYGYPTLETSEAANDGRIYLGGCIVTTNDAMIYCDDCRKVSLDRQTYRGYRLLIEKLRKDQVRYSGFQNYLKNLILDNKIPLSMRLAAILYVDNTRNLKELRLVAEMELQTKIRLRYNTVSTSNHLH